jgi:hypothetical protein
MNRFSPSVRRSLATAAIATLTCILALALAAGPAGARAPKREVASFDVVVKGVQKISQSFHHAPENECDITDNSTITERVVFKSEPTRFIAYEVPGLNNPVLTPAARGGFPAAATVTRNYTPLIQVPPASPQCGENDGNGESAETRMDCGSKKVAGWGLQLEFDERAKSGLALAGKDIKDPFENCVSALGDLAFPSLLGEGSGGKKILGDLPAGELFDRGLGKIIVLGGGTRRVEEPDVSAKVSIEWDVALTRLK